MEIKLDEREKRKKVEEKIERRKKKSERILISPNAREIGAATGWRREMEAMGREEKKRRGSQDSDRNFN